MNLKLEKLGSDLQNLSYLLFLKGQIFYYNEKSNFQSTDPGNYNENTQL